MVRTNCTATDSILCMRFDIKHNAVARREMFRNTSMCCTDMYSYCAHMLPAGRYCAS